MHDAVYVPTGLYFYGGGAPDLRLSDTVRTQASCANRRRWSLHVLQTVFQRQLMISPSYTCEKLSIAVHLLATGYGSPRDRLMAALEKTGMLGPAAGFPEGHHRERMERLQARLTAVNLNDNQGAMRNTAS